MVKSGKGSSPCSGVTMSFVMSGARARMSSPPCTGTRIKLKGSPSDWQQRCDGISTLWCQLSYCVKQLHKHATIQLTSMTSDSPGGWNAFPVAGFVCPMTVAGVSRLSAMVGKGAMTASLAKRPGKPWTMLHVRPPVVSQTKR